MGTELGPDYYNEIFESGGLFASTYQAPWLPIWIKAASWINDSNVDAVVDLGCGPGHLARILLEAGYQGTYSGYDFADVAIEKARQLVDDDRYGFTHANLKGVNVSELTGGRKAAYVSTEFLEHVEWDLELIRTIPAGSLFVGSVPAFDSPGHVRHFPDLADVKARYGQVITMAEAMRIGRAHYVFCGTVK